MLSDAASPFSKQLEAGLRSRGLLKIDDLQIQRLREYMARYLDEIGEPDEDQDWARNRQRYLLGHWPTEFLQLSKRVESPIEQQLGAYLLCIHDGYNEVTFDFAPGELVDPEFGTYFRCQQVFEQYRLDFVFKVCFRGRWRFLNVECDGHPFHEKTKEQAERDRARDRFLMQQRFKVVRFTGSEIYRKPEECAEQIEMFLADLVDELFTEAESAAPRRRLPRLPT